MRATFMRAAAAVAVAASMIPALAPGARAAGAEEASVSAAAEAPLAAHGPAGHAAELADGVTLRRATLDELTIAGIELPANAQNIILFLADDLGWSDLPFFNPPKEWSAPDSPTRGADARVPAVGETELRTPDLNRLAARIAAVPRNPASAASSARLGTLETEEGRTVRVVPLDVDGVPGDDGTSEGRATADTFSYFPQSHPLGAACGSQDKTLFAAGCDPSTDILRGHGGLARLAREGLVFPRFYSTAARCSPARAALMIGRHNERAGVIDINGELDLDEVTIADFLKQGCTDPAKDRLCVCRGCGPGGADQAVPCDCFLENPADCERAGFEKYPCYTTGLIGKWHLGSRTRTANAPWQRGFDEFFGFVGGRRGHFKTSKMRCSPVSARYCINAGPLRNRRCTHNSECGTGGVCGLTNTAEHGLYVGADTTNPCVTDELDTAARHADCCEADVKGKPGVYDFAEKRWPTIRSERIEWGNEQGTRWACNDDGDTRESGCPYSTRRIRDHARDFILRHADAQPFFLVLSFTAPHVPHQAPRRTREHYVADDSAYTTTEPNPRLWAMVEELDAAVGSVLEVLDREGVCDLDRNVACTPGGDQCGAGDRCLVFGECLVTGWPCTDDSQCPAGGLCSHAPGATLADKTAVFFTSDHAQTHGDFGDPRTRGGKGSVYEGGIRTGLLVRAPDLSLDGRSEAVGSAVDLFPTIAAAAGYSDRVGLDERLRVRVCAKGESSPCTTDADCPGESNRCVRRRALDGRNLLPSLAADGRARDTVFATFVKDTATVVTREGWFEDKGCGPLGLAPCADKVCGLHLRIPSLDTEEPDDSGPLVRNVRAASCVPCRDDGDCNWRASTCEDDGDCVDGAQCQLGRCAAMCEVLGKVCADEQAAVECTDDRFATCPASELAGMSRCERNADCPRGQECIDRVRVACDSCMSAAWKLRRSGELYDLTSNPEEEQKLFKRDRASAQSFDEDGNGRLNCFQQQGPGEVLDPCQAPRAGSVEQKVCNVQNELGTMLSRWARCVSAPQCTTPGCSDCDDDLCETAPATCN